MSGRASMNEKKSPIIGKTPIQIAAEYLDCSEEDLIEDAGWGVGDKSINSKDDLYSLAWSATVMKEIADMVISFKLQTQLMRLADVAELAVDKIERAAESRSNDPKMLDSFARSFASVATTLSNISKNAGTKGVVGSVGNLTPKQQKEIKDNFIKEAAEKSIGIKKT